MADTSITGTQSFNPLYGDSIPDAQPIPSSPAIPAAPDITTNVQPQAPAPAQSGVWQRVLMGALVGLAGGAGAKNFGQGVAGGAGASLAYAQQQKENAQRQQRIDIEKQQLQFESVRAADSHIAALDQHTRAEQLSAESKLDYKQKSAEYQNYLQDSFGIVPDLSFADDGHQATAGMQTLANQNGGTIPPVVTVQQPDVQGKSGQIAVYSPSQQSFQQNSAKWRKVVDTQRAVLGQPPIDDRAWNSMGFKGQRDASQAALQYLSPVPSFTKDTLPVVLAQRQQQLDVYKKHKDANGQPDADPATVKQLQNGIDYLKAAQGSVTKQENDQAVAKIKATAPAEAQAAALKAGAETEARLKAMSVSAKNPDGTWNMSSIPVALVEGNMDPSQLSKRSQDYNSKIQQANEYSQAKYGKPFDIAKAQGDYKFATDKGTQNTLKYLNSLTGDPRTKSEGNLDLLVRYSNQIKRTDFPALNDAAAWARLETGDPNIVMFHNAATDAADQFAKIMAGGGSGSATSDAKIRQGQEMFRTGFSKGQVVASASSVKDMLSNRKRELIGDNTYLQRWYGGDSATQSAQPIYATAPGKPRLMSTDGGKTWQPAP